MGVVGVYSAVIAILFGVMSTPVIRSSGAARCELPLLAWLAPPPAVGASGECSGVIDGAIVRLSLDGTPPPETRRPFRTTLLPSPGLPAPDDRAAAPLPPERSAEVPAVPVGPLTPRAAGNGEARPPGDGALAFRQIRLSLDQPALGALSHAQHGPPRPIRLFLNGDGSEPARQRPFRNVLE